MSCGADTIANGLMTSLTAGEDLDIELPDISGDLFNTPIPGIDGIYGPVSRLTNDDLTEGTLEGEGTFDALMRGYKVHLQEEYKSNRISGAEYTKAYIALTEAAMSNATQFLLGRDQSYWAALAAQLQAQANHVAIVTARIELETAKLRMQAMALEANTNKANYVLAKMRLSGEDMAYCISKYNYEFILPLQKLGQEKQNSILQGQVEMIPTQKEILSEQLETARAQTLDLRKDGTAIVGSIGKQKDLYSQQITSYKRDAEAKAARIFTDAWITMKTIDEGLLPPDGFQNTNLDLILTTLKDNNDL